MDRISVSAKLTTTFQKVFKDQSLVVTEQMTANDVEGWDSLTHMVLIAEVENDFSIKFKLKELTKMRNVGDMIDIIILKHQ